MNPALWAYGALAMLAASLAAFSGGYVYGHGSGKAQAIAKQDAQTARELREIITSQAQLVDAAGKASVAIRAAVATRQRADSLSTKEMRDALERTAADRAGCRFPDDSLRELAAARDRAAQAAAGGTGAKLPGAGRGADGNAGG